MRNQERLKVEHIASMAVCVGRLSQDIEDVHAEAKKTLGVVMAAGGRVLPAHRLALYQATKSLHRSAAFLQEIVYATGETADPR